MKKKKDHHKAVFGIYKSRADVERAVEMLRAAGFRYSDVSVLLPTKGESQKFAHEKSTKAPEGAAAGATAGAVIGGSLGWLVGIGALALPGLGPLIAAGPITAALAGLGVGGAVGGISGALIGLGFPEYEAKRYAGRVEDGGILLSVHTDDKNWLEKAEYILRTSGAEDVSSSVEVGADENTKFHRTQKQVRRDESLETRPPFAGRGFEDSAFTQL